MAVGRRPGGVLRGGARGATRPSGVFLGLVALFGASGMMVWTGFGHAGLGVFLFVVSGWLISLSLHEYAHAVLAYRAGDHGVVDRGYLTLNPLRYTHPLLSIVLPVVVLLLGGIGMPGGAVWVDRHAVRTRGMDSMISAAGPAVNVLLTVALAIPFLLGVDGAAHPEFWAGVALLAFLQLTASVLNLAPIPGVDGGNLIQPWLSQQWRRGFDVVAPFGMLLLFALIFQPEVRAVFFAIVFTLADLLGLPPDRYFAGLDLLRFWS